MLQESYDEVPYESYPYEQSHPTRMATLGHIFGMSPAPVSHCRVLELGCASGGNLIPIAYNLPDSEFVGVDLSKVEVGIGTKVIGDLGLTNVTLRHGNIMDVDEGWGKFDYIICHGVYSWVPGDVQEKILAVCRANLAPEGIAYISYNTYPGWHLREMIRHMMLYHANQFDTPREKVEQARCLLEFLAKSASTRDNYGIFLKNELDIFQRHQDWYVYHDQLAQVNEPLYFYQFVERAGRHDLQYLAEATFATMLAGGFPEDVATTLGRISRNIIHSEQYMDFLRNRPFRETLLCHCERQLQRNIGNHSVEGLMASSSLKVSGAVDVGSDKRETFRIGQEITVDTNFPPTKAALKILSENWPKALELDALYQQAMQAAGGAPNLPEAECRETIGADLLKCYSIGALHFCTWQAQLVPYASDRPKISELAQYQIRHNLPLVSQIHKSVSLAPAVLQLAQALDGKRDREGLYRHMAELREQGKIEVEENGQVVTDPEKIHEAMRNSLEPTLTQMARVGLLIA